MKNPFTRRISRHLAVSALFRKSENTPAGQWQRKAEAAFRPMPQERLQVAALLPQAQLEALPEGFMAGAETIPAALPEMDEEQILEERIRQAERYSTPAGAGTGVSIPSAQRTIQAAASLPAGVRMVTPPSAEGQPSEALSREWPRLQAILRGHQQADGTAGEDAFEPSAPQSRPIQPKPAVQPSKPVVTELDHSSFSPKPAESAGDEILPSGAPSLTIRTERKPETVPETPAQEFTQMDMNAAGIVPAAQSIRQMAAGELAEKSDDGQRTVPHAPIVQGRIPATSSVQTPQPGLQKTAEPETGKTAIEPETGDAVDEFDLGVVQPSELRGSVPIPTKGLSRQETEKTETAQSLLQRKPLEEVWPVQQLGRPPENFIPAAQVQQPETQPDLAENIRIREALEAVEAGQPTDSRVELITPRRPRPQATAVQTRPPSVQGKAAQNISPQYEEDMKEEESAAGPVRQISHMAQPAEVQKQAAPVQENEPRPEWVETEIGPLPADLWQLMGEEPPAGQVIHEPSAEQPGLTETIAGPGQTGARPVQQAPLRIQREVQTVQADTDTRQSEAATGEATDGTQTGQTPTPTPAQSLGQQGQDGALSPALIDKLVREVYLQIKRRFSIERERLRKS